MKLPLQITFHNLEHSPAIETLVRERARRLDSYCKSIMNCRVVIEAPHRHHRRGNAYVIRLDLTVPGGEIAVNREPAQHHAYTDIHVAVRDAFDTARRLLEDYVRRRRGKDKLREKPAHGKVRELLPRKNCGFIETPDGRDVYFHRHAVLHNNYGKLHAGTEVAFVEEPGEEGPQASTVRLVGRHGHS